MVEIPVSVRGYHRMGEAGLLERKTELIRGVIVEKVTKSPFHAYLINVLYALVQKYVPRDCHPQCGDPLTFADSEPEPDIAVVPGKLSDYARQHPTTAKLVIEVSFSSDRLDQELADVYAEARVEEYWIVRGLKRTIELYRKPVDGRYSERRTFRSGEILGSSALPGLEVNLTELFAPGSRVGRPSSRGRRGGK